MNPAELTKREFVLGGASLVGALAFAGGPVALLAPSRAWALPLEHLGEHEGATLLRMTRHIYPHDTLEDAVYALVVKALDDEAGSDAAVATLLRQGVSELDAEAKAGGSADFLSRSAGDQLASLTKRAEGAFFQKVRSTAVVALYNNELAFAHFGYEGPAFEKGGYLTRGFNDLQWLPEPSEAASPSL